MAPNMFQTAYIVMQNWSKISRVAELSAPIVTEFRKVAPELMEHVNDLQIAFGLGRNISPDALQFDVKWLQGALTRAGFPVDIDGEYGEKTHAAVRAFQKKHGLDVDGWVGPLTAEKLLKV